MPLKKRNKNVSGQRKNCSHNSSSLFFSTVLPIISLGSDVKKRRRLQSFGPIFSSFSDSLSAGQSSTYFLLESRRIFLPLHVIKWPAITYDFPGVIFRVLLGFCHGQDFQRLKSETSGRPILEKRSSTNPIISDTTNFNSFLIGLIIMEEFCIFAASFFIITWGIFYGKLALHVRKMVLRIASLTKACVSEGKK